MPNVILVCEEYQIAACVSQSIVEIVCNILESILYTLGAVAAVVDKLYSAVGK